ncbi:hypothetical protein ON010_g10857 [Phytophthora cinnamomi]|nr:hypothetical protein ON010_g10857 [Phytophthora cinnamomi]
MAAEDRVLRVLADVHRALALGQLPARRVHVVEAQLLLADADAHGRAGTGLQLHVRETNQRQGGELRVRVRRRGVGRRTNIHLRHLHALHAAGVGHRERDAEDGVGVARAARHLVVQAVGALLLRGARRREVRVAVLERRVAETVAEREQHARVRVHVPAVAVVQALAERRVAAVCGHALRVLRVAGHGRVQACRVRHGQAALRHAVAEQQVGRGPAALLVRVQHLQHGGHVVQPWHQHGLRVVQYHDGVRVCGSHLLHKLVQAVVQGQARLGGAVGEREHDGRVDLLGDIDG